MVLTKEYRICMPLTVEEVKVHFVIFKNLRHWTKSFLILLIFMDIIYYSIRLVSCI